MSSRVGGGEGNDERCKRVDLSLGKALNEVTDRGQADFRVSAWVKRGGRKGGGRKTRENALEETVDSTMNDSNRGPLGRNELSRGK